MISSECYIILKIQKNYTYTEITKIFHMRGKKIASILFSFVSSDQDKQIQIVSSIYAI
ncbi:hypothetical protein DSUL_160119 [Desulfovibrionales bacterium]